DPRVNGGGKMLLVARGFVEGSLNAGAQFRSKPRTRRLAGKKAAPVQPSTLSSEKSEGRACGRSRDGSGRCCTWSQRPPCAAPAWDRESAATHSSPRQSRSSDRAC